MTALASNHYQWGIRWHTPGVELNGKSVSNTGRAATYPLTREEPKIYFTNAGGLYPVIRTDLAILEYSR
jgi:hypothetical protein